ncbi:MAG: anti-sigma factor family protein [Anaerolineae bacterium]
MNHQPFETWLLEEQPLNAAQKRELQEHLQVCSACASLAEIEVLLLKPALMPAPAGFAQRFQQRLLRQRARERGQRLWGMILLLVMGVALLVGMLAPLVNEVGAAPAKWINYFIGYFLFLSTSLQAAVEVFRVVLRFLPGFVPPFFWIVLLSALFGLGLLWIFSIWRLSERPRGV